MGMQIPCGFCAQISQKEAVWQSQKASGGYPKAVVSAKRSRIVGRAPNAGPHSHVFERSTEIQHRIYNWVFERQKCGENPSRDSQTPASHRDALLGSRVLCQYARAG